MTITFTELYTSENFHQSDLLATISRKANRSTSHDSSEWVPGYRVNKYARALG